MSPIRQIFEQNQPIIEFAYGLSFFIMGLAIALQSRSSSRLELARSLAWLAAFGITHSLYIWGELFSPVQEAYLGHDGAEVLHAFHLLMLSVSFGCLMEFGVALLRPLRKGQWLRWVTAGWMAFYLFYILVILPQTAADSHAWHDIAEAIARYTIGFPGGLLAAYGLREQTFLHIAPLHAPHIVSMLRGTGVALAVYAVIGGLIPPPVPFFPGNLINTALFEQLYGVPPLVPLSLLGVVLVVTVIRAMEVFQVETERRIEWMEQQQILAAERERIGRDLHDSTIQTAYTAGLLVDSARKLAEPDSQISNRLDKAVFVLNEVIADLRRYLGELHGNTVQEPIAESLRRITGDPRFRSLVDISLKIEVPEDLMLPARETNHLLAIVHEALSNVVRHAHATEVKMYLRKENDRYLLTIQDDGTGFNGRPKEGYGLRNMQERARLLGGQLIINGRSGKGTSIVLEIPSS